MSKFVLLLVLTLSVHSYASPYAIPPSDIVRFTTGDSSLNLTAAIGRTNWAQHFQSTIDFVNRLLEVKHGAIGLLRTIYTTNNLRFLRNLVGLGVTVGNFTLDYIPDEAVPVTTLLTRAFTAPINKVFQLLTPPDQSPNDAALEEYEVEDADLDSSAPVVFQVTSDETPINVEVNEIVPSVEYSVSSESRVVRSLDQSKNNQVVTKKTTEQSPEVTKEAEEWLKNYKDNQALLNEYRDRVVTLDRLIKSDN